MSNINTNSPLNVASIADSLYKVTIKLKKLHIQRDHNTKIMAERGFGINDESYIDPSVEKIDKIENILKILEKELKQTVENYC